MIRAHRWAIEFLLALEGTALAGVQETVTLSFVVAIVQQKASMNLCVAQLYQVKFTQHTYEKQKSMYRMLASSWNWMTALKGRSFDFTLKPFALRFVPPVNRCGLCLTCIFSPPHHLWRFGNCIFALSYHLRPGWNMGLWTSGESRDTWMVLLHWLQQWNNCIKWKHFLVQVEHLVSAFVPLFWWWWLLKLLFFGLFLAWGLSKGLWTSRQCTHVWPQQL